jgi:hypothetical protein
VLGNGFAAKEQQHLVFPSSPAPRSLPLTRLSFIPPANIGRTDIRNNRLYISSWEIFWVFVE